MNLNLVGGNANDSNLTRSGNGNTVEVYIAGGQDGVVNITVRFEEDNFVLEDSNSHNPVKIYIGVTEVVDMGNAAVHVVGGNNTSSNANISHS